MTTYTPRNERASGFDLLNKREQEVMRARVAYAGGDVSVTRLAVQARLDVLDSAAEAVERDGRCFCQADHALLVGQLAILDVLEREAVAPEQPQPSGLLARMRSLW
jgi:hypothetical protein